MPDPTTTAVDTAPQSTELTRGTTQDADRAALYEKHYGGTTQTDAAPPAEPTSDSTAQVETTTPEPVAAPPAPAVSPELLELMQSMQAELAQLRAERKPAEVAAPAPETERRWVQLLREGKVDEAEEALADAIAKRNQGPTIDQAVSRAREVARAEADVEAFVKDFQTKNPDLAPMERWITIEAQQTLAALQASGRIKSTDDAVREYKKAVTDATESARKIAQTLRGSGKQEAMTRSREVIQASTLSPQQVDSTRQTTVEAEPQPESSEDYFAKRRASESSRRGLAV